MKYRCALALVIASFFGLVAPTQADASAKHTAILHGGQSRIVLRTSELRSSYLLRAGIVRYDSVDMSSQGLRRQLQQHFDVVLGLLFASTPASIETALIRLEEAESTSWSESERADWRQRLLSARSLQLQRLMQYRDRGEFPQNEGQTAHPTPIFVDSHDTACAIGHLMRLSDYQQAVASIAASANFIHVTDVVGGPITSWILTSGLTLEEAALIQPAYGPRLAPIPVNAIELGTDWAGVFGDLRFSNFQTFREADGAEIPPVNISVSHTFCGFMSCETVAPFLPRPELELTSSRQLVLSEAALNATDSSPFLLPIDSGPLVEQFSRVVIQFDVDVVSPLQRIIRQPHGSTLFLAPLGSFASNDVSLFVRGDQERFFIDHPASNPDLPSDFGVFFEGGPIWHREPSDFRPTTHLTVVTELLLKNWQPHQSQLLHFDVVTIPEPATFLLLLIGAVSMGARFRSVMVSPLSQSK